MKYDECESVNINIQDVSKLRANVKRDKKKRCMDRRDIVDKYTERYGILYDTNKN